MLPTAPSPSRRTERTSNSPRPQGEGVRRGSARVRPSHGRTCVGCGKVVARQQARAEMVRLVIVPSGDGATVVVDLAGSAKGRGAWVHPQERCLRQAVSRGLPRAISGPMRVDPIALMQAIVVAATRRLNGLLSSARRSGRLAVGATAVTRSSRRGAAQLFVVAVDAAAAAELSPVRQAASLGAVVTWGDKAHWGAQLGLGGEVGVMAIESESIAAEARRVVALAAPLATRVNLESGHVVHGEAAAAAAAGLERKPSGDGGPRTGGSGGRRQSRRDVRFRAE